MKIEFAPRYFNATINLPLSKSYLNRELIIAAISGTNPDLQLDAANDVIVLHQLLFKGSSDAQDAGTSMRFATAYFALTGYQGKIYGTERMHERPIAELVEALKLLGADIQYLGENGFPPLSFNGFQDSGVSELEINGSTSSQFISAICLVAPLLKRELKIKIIGAISSRPYIDLTLFCMKQHGVESRFEGNRITILKSEYVSGTPISYADWSAAGYWFAILACAELGSELKLNRLKLSSNQADEQILEWAPSFGISVFVENDKVLVRREEQTSPFMPNRMYDFSSCPDLAQTIIALYAILGKSMKAKGLDSLRIKETDRVLALQESVAKLGCDLKEFDSGVFSLEILSERTKELIEFHTFNDHRMAMAFAPAAIFGPIKFDKPEVVIKSYPRFWNDLETAGFKITG